MNPIQHVLHTIRHHVARDIIGQEVAIELLTISLLSEGHVLLEDVPGMGKTVLAKAMAESIGCSFGRIQCTPDLLPSDVVGTTIFNQKTGDFELRKGPVFHQILLTDEINRAIPRTQSALLEAMGEGQVTLDGVTMQLERPFFVIATQNPVESHGTFPLPQAQLDRFLLKFSLGYPSVDEEREILRRLSGERSAAGTRAERSESVSPVDIATAQQEVGRIRMAVDVESYLLELIRASRSLEGVAVGASPRALIALGRAARALAGVRGRDFVIPDDIQYLAPFVLAHRLVLDPSNRLKNRTASDIVRMLLDQVPVPVEEDGR